MFWELCPPSQGLCWASLSGCPRLCGAFLIAPSKDGSPLSQLPRCQPWDSSLRLIMGCIPGCLKADISAGVRLPINHNQCSQSHSIDHLILPLRVKIVQQHWKTVCYFLTKLNIHIYYDLTIMLLDDYPRQIKTDIQIKTCVQMSIVELVIISPQTTQMAFQWVNG